MDATTVLSGLVALALGTGGGGLVGALVVWRKAKAEADAISRSSDAEQFKTLFPAGLGEAVKVYQEQVRVMNEELVTLREKEQQNHLEQMRLRGELESVKIDLGRAKKRIEYLESRRPQ